ncbi:MAG: peptidase [Ramlibacter sp.]|jgi:predicted Zn-dependent protease|nr:peptidase [Ramlibacter sp.]
MSDLQWGRAGVWRRFVLCVALLALSATGALAQRDAREGVNVGKSSRLSQLVPADEVEKAAGLQYHELMQQAAAKRALAQPDHPQLQRIRAVAQRLIPQAPAWNERAANWKWEVNLIGSNQINAFCMPGGKIVFYSGILDQLKLTEDEIAMVMGHEMAHALREHARERMAKGALTSVGANVLVQVLGMGQVGQALTGYGAQLLSLKFSRSDESEADLVGMEIAARAGYDPRAAVTLWKKMGQAAKASPPQWISTHPSGTSRIAQLQKNLPKVMPLYERAKRR